MKLDRYSQLLADTPIGTTFLWNGEHRLVHVKDCGGRYTTTVKHPIMAQVA